MQSHWQQLFTLAGSPQPFSQALDSYIAPLTHYGLLATQGADAAKFIQGQSSCDIREINNNQAQNGSFSNPKGRSFANFMACQNSEDSYLLRMPENTVDGTQQALAKYLAFSKAEQTPATDNYFIFGLKGETAKQNLKMLFDKLPSSPLGCSQQASNIVICIDAELALYECWVSTHNIAEIWPKIRLGLTFADPHYWQLECIRLGQADITEATNDEFIPQMLNYQLTGGISFTKGCFTGQEIIARMQYKGKVKKRIYHVAFESSATINTGAELFIKDKNQATGTVINICSNENKQLEALVVLTKEASEESQLFLADGTALAVNLLELPYSTETEK